MLTDTVTAAALGRAPAGIASCTCGDPTAVTTVAVAGTDSADLPGGSRLQASCTCCSARRSDWLRLSVTPRGCCEECLAPQLPPQSLVSTPVGTGFAGSRGTTCSEAVAVRAASPSPLNTVTVKVWALPTPVSRVAGIVHLCSSSSKARFQV